MAGAGKLVPAGQPSGGNLFEVPWEARWVVKQRDLSPPESPPVRTDSEHLRVGEMPSDWSSVFRVGDSEMSWERLCCVPEAHGAIYESAVSYRSRVTPSIFRCQSPLKRSSKTLSSTNSLAFLNVDNLTKKKISLVTCLVILHPPPHHQTSPSLPSVDDCSSF